MGGAERITLHPQSELTEVHGTGRLTGVTWRDHHHDRDVHLDAAAVFLLIGAQPCTTALLDAGVELDDEGFVITRLDKRFKIKDDEQEALQSF